MDLNKGGVAPSKATSNAFKSAALGVFIPPPLPRSKSTDSEGKKKSKRKKDESATAGSGGGKDSDSLSSKKSRIDSTPQGILPSSTDRYVHSRTPISCTRSTGREDEVDETNSMMPPPSHHGFAKVCAPSVVPTRSEVDEYGYREYASPEPRSPERPIPTFVGEENEGLRSAQNVGGTEKREGIDNGEEGEECLQTGLSPIREEESQPENFTSSRVEAQSQEGGRFPRFGTTSHFGLNRFSPQINEEHSSVSPPPAAQAQPSPHSPTSAAVSPAAVPDEVKSPTPPDYSRISESKLEIDPLNPIPALFSGPNPFLEHAKALAQSKEIESDVHSNIKAEEVVEKVQSENSEFANRFKTVLDKTQSLFERSLERQNGLVAKLEEHSTELANEEEQISETKQRLSKWSAQLLNGGDK
ncbi:hypothetical protein JCM3765_007810 [Sporobolomyces pararoseus]